MVRPTLALATAKYAGPALPPAFLLLFEPLYTAIFGISVFVSDLQPNRYPMFISRAWNFVKGKNYFILNEFHFGNAKNAFVERGRQSGRIINYL
jgi:hypothetical protein